MLYTIDKTRFYRADERYNTGAGLHTSTQDLAQADNLWDICCREDPEKWAVTFTVSNNGSGRETVTRTWGKPMKAALDSMHAAYNRRYAANLVSAHDEQQRASRLLVRGQQCVKCQKFFAHFYCNSRSGECDCPKCQGQCSCPDDSASTKICYAPHGLWDAPPLSFTIEAPPGVVQQVRDAMKAAGHEII